MSMSRLPQPPMSPMSMSSNDSGLLGRYESFGGSQVGGSSDRAPALAGTPNDVPYRGGPYGTARPPTAGGSPHSSQHPSGSTDVSRPSITGSNGRPPSSASSFAASNDGRVGGRPHNRDSSRSQFNPGEDALQRHYAALKQYLAVHLQDEKGNMKPNRARDKLLRLSVTQFMELSTDVYDELIRREDERMQRVENVPRFLLPKNNFHPKRNQARQKLSTLPIERFRQLATDVFFELERRIPRLGGNSRPMSNMSDASTYSRQGMRPSGGPLPPGQRGPYGGPPAAAGGRRPSEAGSLGGGSLGRPLPKQFQSNTIIPNKSTMVEDDDDAEDDEDAFGLDQARTPSGEGQGSSAEDQEKIRAQEAEIAELKSRLEADSSRSAGHEEERSQWTSLREELEQKHVDAQLLVEQLTSELSALKVRHTSDAVNYANELRQLESTNSTQTSRISQLETEVSTLATERDKLAAQIASHEPAAPPDYEAKLKALTQSLASQESTTQEVQAQAMQYLREMRTLSNQNDAAIEQEEKLAAKISKLERDNDEWRQRYAKVKAQNKHLRASTMGLGLQGGGGLDAAGLVRQEGLIDKNGRVKDVQVTAFQVAVEELLRVARGSSTAQMLECVKGVVVGTQAITSAAASSENGSSKDPAELPRLQARVTGTANSLITATKQHAASHGLSPVALLDAAASNLTAAVVELIKAVRIRPTGQDEAANGTDASFLHVQPTGREVAEESETDDESHYGRDSYGLETLGNGTFSLNVPQLAPPTAPQQQQSQDHTQPSVNPESAAVQGAKKGWFGWAGKWNDDSANTSPSVGGVTPNPGLKGDDDFVPPESKFNPNHSSGAVAAAREAMGVSNAAPTTNGAGHANANANGNGIERKGSGIERKAVPPAVVPPAVEDTYNGYDYDSGSDYDPYR
ncbi:unnamed protein product [Zymoseptoria tritici ST99CH_1A5]|uniref:GIT Spa2 homology (SHD) domain-containing protein n=1 Tax=Zymoseptoria tritici ST99CH_1A5 TaxID=1276529 RepID=A0A1Y6L2G1_ZYMTR|nr:unnamed protein product [Zymoseptoria tritici ST99CH_1A5]